MNKSNFVFSKYHSTTTKHLFSPTPLVFFIEPTALIAYAAVFIHFQEKDPAAQYVIKYWYVPRQESSISNQL